MDPESSHVNGPEEKIALEDRFYWLTEDETISLREAYHWMTDDEIWCYVNECKPEPVVSEEEEETETSPTSAN